MAELNIYQKLQNARVEFLAMKVGKSGLNKFAKYKYFELSDILPPIIDIFARYKLCSIISFGQDLATMTIYNTEKPNESIVITSPMSSADLKACHAVQNLGAVETYQRRYLYMVALEIIENDALDATTGDKKTRQTKEQANIAIEQEMPSKYDGIKCNFCGKGHGKKGDIIVLVGGKWGAKSCYEENQKPKAKQENKPLPEAEDIRGREPGELPY